jgi:predicted acylesterase/phospholipase RssA
MIDIEELRALTLRISVIMGTSQGEVIDALTGTCWDEEMAGDIKGRDDDHD